MDSNFRARNGSKNGLVYCWLIIVVVINKKIKGVKYVGGGCGAEEKKEVWKMEWLEGKRTELYKKIGRCRGRKN